MGVMVVPVHNEESEIASFLRQWSAIVPELPLILVFDRCTDNTLEVAQQAMEPIIQEATERNKSLRVHFEIIHENSYGKAGAVLFGLWCAVRFGYSMQLPVIFWDADNEYILKRSTVEKLIHHVLNWGGLGSARRSGRKLFRSRLAAGATRMALSMSCHRKTPVDDILTAVHAMPLLDALQILSHSRSFDMETRIVRYFMKRNVGIYETEVEYIPRTIGKKIKAYHLFGILVAALGLSG